jgi:glycosyltransferase involved in cell wall biosynthesis
MGLFLEMARRLPKVAFVIVGSISPEKSSYYDSLRATAPSNVSFIMSPLRKVPELLGKAKVYVHCAQNEHFGITIVEAMSAGCVPVVNDSGGPREIVSDDVGYRWNHIDEAVARVAALVKDDDVRRQLSKGAASRANQFGPEPFELGIGKVLHQYG